MRAMLPPDPPTWPGLSDSRHEVCLNRQPVVPGHLSPRETLDRRLRRALPWRLQAAVGWIPWELVMGRDVGEPGDAVVNVCFHGVGTPGRELEPGESFYWVEHRQFHCILDEVATWPALRISFDDGNSSDLEHALPALLERGLRADFFVLAGRLGHPGSLCEADLRELHRHGMVIGTHGMAHRSWRGMDPATGERELVTARKRLAEVVQAPVDSAACPLGRYDRRLLADLRRLGYTRVYTSDRRPARPTAWLQPRYSVREDDTPESLRATALRPPRLDRRAYRSAVGLAKRLR